MIQNTRTTTFIRIRPKIFDLISFLQKQIDNESIFKNISLLTPLKLLQSGSKQ